MRRLVYLAHGAPALVASEQRSFRLNDDVVAIISRHVHDADLLALALTCKQVFNIARTELRIWWYIRKYAVLNLVNPSINDRHETRTPPWRRTPGQVLRLIKDDPFVAQQVMYVTIDFSAWETPTSAKTAAQQATRQNNDDVYLADGAGNVTASEKESEDKVLEDDENSNGKYSSGEITAIQHFLNHSEFLTEAEKKTWTDEILKYTPDSFFSASILLCSLLPSLTAIDIAHHGYGLELDHLAQFAAAVRKRPSSDILINSSLSLLQIPRRIAHGLQDLHISSLHDNYDWEEDTPVRFNLAELTEICFIPTLESLTIEGATSGNKEFEWPSDAREQSQLKEVRFWYSWISARDAYTFMCGLPKMNSLEFTVQPIDRSDEWRQEFDSFEKGLTKGRKLAWYFTDYGLRDEMMPAKLRVCVTTEKAGEWTVPGSPDFDGDDDMFDFDDDWEDSDDMMGIPGHFLDGEPVSLCVCNNCIR